MSEMAERTRAIGINHVALEVGNLDEALAFYGALFDLKLRGRHDRMAFIDLGDQFLNLSEGRTQVPDRNRHFGLVVENREPVRKALKALRATLLPGPGLDFIDPWGNHVQVVQYREIQFTKAPHVLRGMGIERLEKGSQAMAELREKGMAPE